MVLVLFPNNLFEIRYLPKREKHVFLLEDPIFFGYRQKKMRFNKKKIMLHRASMKYYASYLASKKYKVNYVEYHELTDLNYNCLQKHNIVKMFEINDHLLTKRLERSINAEIVVLQNPNFLLSMDQLINYNNNNPDRIFHKQFYTFVKDELDILVGIKSYDNDNRKKIKNNVQIPDILDIKPDKYNIEAITYVEQHFAKNYGDCDNFIYPIDHKKSKSWLKHFIVNKFAKYGDYQDAILQEDGFLFHSIISPMLNIGLLNPDYVIKMILEKCDKVPMNACEGFIRQILGWREYQRYCYHFAYKDMINSNYFNHQTKLSKKWYNGTIGIKPVDDAIHFGFKYGYLHHIIRLMIMSNFMCLCRIHPDECYKWFMEFAIDSYDWIMIQNVYSMGQWADGGMTMRKPYISSDNYIVNMSDYSSKDDWADIWNSLYYLFLKDHEKQLKKTPYVRNMIHIKNKDLSVAKKFLATLHE